ncbi:hypothetical protein K438DRAFT_2177974, partial [Mycena galopus ATCC 62051]
RVFNSSERRARVTEILCLRPEGRHGRVSHGSAQPQERAVYVDVWLAGSDPMENTLLLTEQRRSLGWSTATASSTLSDQLYGSLSRRKMRYPGGGAAALEASATAPPGPGFGWTCPPPGVVVLELDAEGNGEDECTVKYLGLRTLAAPSAPVPGVTISFGEGGAERRRCTSRGRASTREMGNGCAHLTSGRTYYAYAVAQPLLSSAGH